VVVVYAAANHWVIRGSSSAQREGHNTSATGHVMLAQLPVHRLGGAPGDLHLFGDLLPHFGFESRWRNG